MPTVNNSPLESKESKRLAQNKRLTREGVEFNNPYLTMADLYRPKQPNKRPECPAYLGKRGKELWDMIILSLPDSHLPATLTGQMETYVWTYIRWQQVRRSIDREGMLQRRTVKGKEVVQTHELLDLMIKLTTVMMRQWRTMYPAFATHQAEIGLLEKMTVVRDEVQKKSSRGRMIGGEKLNDDVEEAA
jgi:hypothetical protein